MRENIENFDGGGSEKREELKNYFSYFIFPEDRTLIPKTDHSITSSADPIPNKNHAIQQAREALKAAMAQTKYRNALLIAEVQEFDESTEDEDGYFKTRFVWEADSKNTQGVELSEEWEKHEL